MSSQSIYESADDRRYRLKNMTTQECIEALTWRWTALQPSIRTLLEKRLARDRKATNDKTLAEAIDAALAQSERARNGR